MKTLIAATILALSLVSCGDVPPAADVTVTESELITYPTGTICPSSVYGHWCAPYPNRLMRCWNGNTGEQVTGCRLPVTGPISYYRTCVVECTIYRP